MLPKKKNKYLLRRRRHFLNITVTANQLFWFKYGSIYYNEHLNTNVFFMSKLYFKLSFLLGVYINNKCRYSINYVVCIQSVFRQVICLSSVSCSQASIDEDPAKDNHRALLWHR